MHHSLSKHLFRLCHWNLSGVAPFSTLLVEAITLQRCWLASWLLPLRRRKIGMWSYWRVSESAPLLKRRRTRTFYYLYCCFITTELIGPPIAAWTSGISNWLPLGIGIISLLICFLVLAIMPEPYSKRESSVQISRGSDTVSTSAEPSYGQENIVYYAWRTWQATSIFALLQSQNMILAFPIFFIGVFRGVSLRVLLQYVPVKFGWKLSSVSTKDYPGLSRRMLNWQSRRTLLSPLSPA